MPGRIHPVSALLTCGRNVSRQHLQVVYFPRQFRFRHAIQKLAHARVLAFPQLLGRGIGVIERHVADAVVIGARGPTSLPPALRATETASPIANFVIGSVMRLSS